MQREDCALPDQCVQYFDITHSFKAGSATYHILGLRKDRPSYRDNYYIFQCTGHNQDQTINAHSSLVPIKHSLPRSRTGIDRRALASTDETQSSRVSASNRARTQSPKTASVDTTTMKDLITETMKNERRLMLNSLRKEMNGKKKTILRTIKKGNRTLLNATQEANKSDQLIHLLEEQKTLLNELSENFVKTTTDSMERLKETLVEVLNNHHTALQSMEDIQSKLVKTVEDEIQKLVQKNEQLLALTSDQTNMMNRLETTLGQKIDNQSNMARDNSGELNRLLVEQQRLLSNVAHQQQQYPSIDLIKETMVNVIQEQQKIPARSNTEVYTAPSLSRLQNHDLSPIQTRSAPLSETQTDQVFRAGNTKSSSAMTMKMSPDYHLLKISIRSPDRTQLYAKLMVDGIEYSRPLYTLCQRDPRQKDIYNCYIAPPTRDGLYQLTLVAKTDRDTTYQTNLSIRLPGSHLFQPTILPLMHQAFYDYHCILIEPLRRGLRENEQVLLHMVVPEAHKVKIRNGNETVELDGNEMKHAVVRKKVRVRGDLCIIGCWDRKIDATICVFSMV